MGAPLLIAIMGPTASGKSALAERLADELDAQLINADAFQVYRGMDVGTAKPHDKTRYRLLDLKKPDEAFGVGEWVNLAAEELGKLYELGKSAVVVGGSGLYVRALFENYQEMAPPPSPQLRSEVESMYHALGLKALAEVLGEKSPALHAKTDLNNPVRVKRALERAMSPNLATTNPLPPFTSFKFAIQATPAGLEPCIAQRTRTMIQGGWLEEVERLLTEGYTIHDPGFRAIGYQSLAAVIAKENELNATLVKINGDVRRYAKRQNTWIRTEPRVIMLVARDGNDRFEEALRFMREMR